MNKYKSLVFRELKLSARHYMFRGLMFLAFIAMLILVMLVIKPQAAREGGAVDGFALMGAYITGIMGAVIIGEDNGVYKSDVNTGWLTFSYALPLNTFEKTMARYISKLIVIAVGAIFTIIGTVLVYTVGGCALNGNILLSLFVFIDAMLIFNIALDAFIMRATDTKALKKMGAAAGIVIAVLIFLPDILSLGKTGSGDEIISEEALQSVAATNDILCKFEMPEILGYISIPLMIVILIVGFIITMKNFERREA